ncbi:hypothetical protein YYC_05919, partial [Plasmodium yoelii 17X]
MEDDLACELFLEADKLLNGSIYLQKAINKSQEYREYCPNNKQCSTRAESIGALSVYLFTNFYNKESGYYEHFIMWLAHTLFKIAKKRNNENAHNITLSSAYDKYLDKSMGHLRQWDILNDVRGGKDPNLKHMSELYTLLNHICNTIADYKKYGATSRKLHKNSVNCLNQYRNLYRAFSGNASYLSLLEKLKKIYDDFRTAAIKNDIGKKNNIESRLLELTAIKKKESHSKNNFKTLDSNGLEDQLEDEKDPEIPKEKSTQEERTYHKNEGNNIVQLTKLQNTMDQIPNQRDKPSVSEGESKVSENEQEHSGKSQGVSIEPTKENLSSKSKDPILPQEIPSIKPVPEPQPQPGPQPQPQPQPGPQQQPGPQPQPQPQPGPQPQPQPPSESSSELPPESPPESPTQKELQKISHPESEPPPKLESQPGTEPPPKLESQPGTEPLLELQIKSQPESQIESKLELQIESQVEPQNKEHVIQPESQDKENMTQPASTQEKSLTSYETIKKITETEFLYDFYKLHISSFYKNITDYGNRLYESASTSLTKGYSAFNNFANDLITQPNKMNVTSQSVDNSIQTKDSGSDSSPPDDTSETPLHSSTQSIDKKIEGEKQKNISEGQGQINEAESRGKISETEGGTQETNPEDGIHEINLEDGNQETNLEGEPQEKELEDKDQISKDEGKEEISEAEESIPISTPNEPSGDSINITLYREIEQLPSEIKVKRDISEIK